MANKKIINATPVESDGIEFKSKFEEKVYNILKDNGLQPEYESQSFILWEGLKPTVPFYTKSKKGELKLNQSKLKDITYTPDFIFTFLDRTIYVEVKGYANDVFPYKFKMFRKILEDMPGNHEVWEIFTKRQLLECISNLKKSLGMSQNQNTEQTQH